MAMDNCSSALHALDDAYRHGEWTDRSNDEANDIARAQVYAALALVDELRRMRERNNTVNPAPTFDEDGAS